MRSIGRARGGASTGAAASRPRMSSAERRFDNELHDILPRSQGLARAKGRADADPVGPRRRQDAGGGTGGDPLRRRRLQPAGRAAAGAAEGAVLRQRPQAGAGDRGDAERGGAGDRRRLAGAEAAALRRPAGRRDDVQADGRCRDVDRGGRQDGDDVRALPVRQEGGRRGALRLQPAEPARRADRDRRRAVDAAVGAAGKAEAPGQVEEAGP